MHGAQDDDRRRAAFLTARMTSANEVIGLHAVLQGVCVETRRS